MISEKKKREIVRAMYREKDKLGSMNKVAKKLEINEGTASANILKEDNWDKVSEKMWANIAAKLDVSLVEREWRIGRTKNLDMMMSVFSIAQNEALFMAVSEKAGSGKSASIAYCLQQDKSNMIYSIQCEEWSRKTFLMRLAGQIGIVVNPYDTADVIGNEVIRFFKHRAAEGNPLLILDETDKLRPEAKRFIIPLYNRLEDEIGLVCVGTENLKKEIENGVRKHEKGYDEIESRLGRKYITLKGYEESDVEAICHANGIMDEGVIGKIWAACNPVKRNVGKKEAIQLVEDARKIKRAVTAEKLKMAREV